MNKTYPKRRPRGRPKKRKSRERLQKHKEMSERDDEEEEIKTEGDAAEIQTEEATIDIARTEETVKEVCSQAENIAIDTRTEEVPPVIDEETNSEILHNEDESATKENDDSSFPKEKITVVAQTENCAATTQTDDDINSFSAHLDSNGVLNLKVTRKEIKEEVKEEEEEEEEEDIEEPQPRASTLPFESSASTSTSPPEAVVAQLNQLQETVVSHILQYQAGVLAQFQQLQQQMLSEINSSNQPQVTVTPIVKREPNGRKRRSSSKFESSVSEEDNSKNGEVQSKRKRTAFSEKQYEILETTFQHNNFPEPIDQHCIALRIKTPYRSIKMWFQNRRASIRKRMMPKEKGTEEDTSEKKPAKNNCDPDTRWYCSVCPSTFISKKFLDAHTEAHKKETLRCANCSMSFTHKVLLDTHRISKCTSISGVDLSHLEDERKELNQSHDKINFIKALSNDPKSSESTCVSSAMLPLLLQKLQKHPKKESEISSPPPLVDPNSLSQVSLPKVENPVILQQQRLMQQLLLAQLQQAAQVKAKEESEDQDTAKETENANGSLTLGGLTIFPVKSSKPTIEIKEEPKSVEELSDIQPSTLHDQIANILENQGIKSSLKCEEDEDSKCGSRESMKEQIQAILRHQEEQRKKSLKTVAQGTGTQVEEAVDLESLRRHRRRTTVFNEVQLRTLYMHFTHCNFPDPAMFKIIGHLVKLDPQVIKIWFQNERSRQRKRAMHIVDEVSAKHKPYKCKDCGMSFAMMTFLVKHSMRHIGETDQDANVRTCPLCLQKWNKEVFSSHLKSRHNVNLSLVEERCPGSLKCYLCSESFPDQENLMIHKHKHLKDEYGDPPRCLKCKTTFVNAICLEAHMETHETGEWSHKCNLCDALFHDKVLLTSHEMGHGVPLAPVSTIDRSRSQLQHSNIRAINAIARKTVASAIESLNSSTESIEEQSSDNEVAKSEKSILSIKSSMLSKNVTPEHPIPTGTTSKTASTNTPTVSTVVATMTSPTLSTAPINNVMTPPTGPVSYVKLIPVQLIPTNPVPSSQSGAPPAGVITGPTTAFLSVPVNFFGAGDASSNPVFSQIFDPSTSASKVSPDEKSNKKKSLPNLIPISDVGVGFIKKEVEPKEEKPPVSDTKLENEESKSIQAVDCVVKEKKEYVPDSASLVSEDEINEDNDETQELTADATISSSHESEPLNDSQDSGKIVSAEVPPKTLIEDGNCEPEDNSALEGKMSSEIQPSQQLTSKKRYVPILPLLPLQLATKEPRVNSKNLTPETPVPQRPKSSRNVPNKRLWEAYKVDRYKRRRTPTYFSGSQREILEAHFDHDNFPDPGEQLAIADQLGVSYPVVKTWFQNTRKNFRKQLKFEKLIPAGGPFHCQKCNVAFISEVSLHEHSEVHNVVTGIKCQECDMSFSHQSVLKTHHAVTHKNAKLGEAIRRKKYGVDILERFSSSQGRFDGENEEVSDSDSPEEESEDGVTNGMTEVGSVKVERSMDDSFDGEDYHPIMAVECILDNSEGEDGVQKSEESSEQSGHKCCSCGESFASFIALKEHNSLHCGSQGPLKPGHFRRRKKLLGKRRVIGNSIRCFDCYRVFPERNSYLEHFRTFPCSSNTSTKRIEYTDEEQRVLVTHYDGNNFPLPSEMSLLARRLGVRYRQVMHWFQNRRSKERKKIKEGGKLPPVECHRCKASFVTEESLSRHKKLAHGEVNNPGTEAETPLMEHACSTPGCGAFFPNEELLVTHSLAHQIDVDAVQTEEEEDDHKLPNLGPTTLWKDFAVLEAHYSDNNFPDPMDIGFIARRLQVDPLHVHLWFKERRKQHIRKLEENGTKVMEGETAVSTQKALSKVCSKCDAAFICQMDLDTHEDMHKSSWSQVCSMCGAEFSNVVVLETHWIRHGIEVKRQSPDRPTKASFSNAQMEVLDTHYEHNNFPMSLEIWLIAMRLNLRPRQVTHWFQNKRGRDRRVQKITTASSRICLHCGASFICDEFLEKHMQRHKIESRFTCSECKVVYMSPVLLETHSLYHTSIPKYRLPRRCNDGVRDPMTEGQVKNTSNVEIVEEQSDSSEGELRIDESENFTISIENNEDEHESEETGVLRGQDEAIDDGDGEDPGPESESFVEKEDVEVSDDFTDKMDDNLCDGERVTEDFELQSSDEKEDADSPKVNFANNKKTIREEVFFDDNSDSSDDDEDEPRLRIVSAYTISGNPEDMDSEEDL